MKKAKKTKTNVMARRGLFHALLRREKGFPLANDHKDVLSFVEDRTASSCFTEKKCSLSGSPRSTFLVCFSLDKSKMASTHGDHSIRITDSFTGKSIRTLVGHPRTPWCITFHPSSNSLLASGCLAGEVRIWDLMGGCEVYVPPDRAAIASVAFHPTDNVLLIATSNKLYFWKWDQPQPFASLQTNNMEEKVRLVKFSPLGDYILTGITNCSQMDANAQDNRNEASVDQLLQSVSCTQLDSDQVSQYIMQQTSRGDQGATTTSHDRPSTSTSTSNTQPPSSDETDLSSRRRRHLRNYRGVFAIFRARDREGGDWNIDTSEMDNDPTDVGRSNIVFNPANTTESMSIGRVNEPNGSPSSSPSSSSSSSSSSSTSSSSTVRPSSPSSASSSFSSSSSSSSTSSTSSSSSSSSSIVYGDSPPASSNMLSSRVLNFSNDLLQSNTSESRNDEVSQSISVLPMEAARNESDSSVSIDMVDRDSVQYGSAGTSQSDNNFVSGVGSVINVGGTSSSSRTSYVTHGSNHSSSLSTLSNQSGSGTAIATATARTFRHVHTAVVIANGTLEGPQMALRTAINRAIAGAFASSGEGAVASNIINTTHRLQLWDFSKFKMLDLKDSKANVIVPCCKIHNDASCDLSADGTLLAAFVPSVLGFPDDGMLGVYSLKKSSFGQCLFTKKFGPNAISVSLSPLNTHVVVGLAARRIHWHLTSQQMMAQVFKLTPDKDSEVTATELKTPIHNIVLSEEDSLRGSHISVNAAFWHPVVGCGLVYGTNRGDLRMRQFGSEP